MTLRELEDRAAPCREADHDGTIDPEMIEQQRVRISLIGWGGTLRERRAEVAEARRGDDRIQRSRSAFRAYLWGRS